MSRFTNRIIEAEDLLEKIQKGLSAEKYVDVEVSESGLKINRSSLHYLPSQTLKIFHEDSSKVRIVMGAFGSGKTTAMIAEMVLKAIKMPVCKDGVRRCRWLVIRNTYNDLKRTCVKSVDDWLMGLGESPYVYQQSPMVRRYNFTDETGKIELEIHFLSIDSEKQLRQLKSFETTNVWLSEVSELEEAVLKFVVGRIGRYPMPELLQSKSYWCGVIAETNAPSERHWLPILEKNAKLLVDNNYQIYRVEHSYILKDKENVIATTIFHQPPALIQNETKQWRANSAAENVTHLEGGYQYYFNMIPNGEEYIRVYVQGKYGTVQAGYPVYARYNDDIHSSLKVDIAPNMPLIYGIDFGAVAPAIVVCQWVLGQLRVLKEFCGDHIYIADLVREEFLPWLDKYAPRTPDVYKKINAYGRYDPAQTDRGFEQLQQFNLDIRMAKTNKIEARIAAVTELLGRISSNGQPGIVISRSECKNLRSGFNGQYVLEQSRMHGEVTYKDTPRKNHPYSDIQDALQYVALEFVRTEGDNNKNQKITTPNPSVMWI